MGVGSWRGSTFEPALHEVRCRDGREAEPVPEAGGGYQAGGRKRAERGILNGNGDGGGS